MRKFKAQQKGFLMSKQMIENLFKPPTDKKNETKNNQKIEQNNVGNKAGENTNTRTT